MFILLSRSALLYCPIALLELNRLGSDRVLIDWPLDDREVGPWMTLSCASPSLPKPGGMPRFVPCTRSARNVVLKSLSARLGAGIAAFLIGTGWAGNPHPRRLRRARSRASAIDVHDGIDDIALRSRQTPGRAPGLVGVQAQSAASTVRLRSGLVLAATPSAAQMPRVALTPGLKPIRQLDRTLCEIDTRFGALRRDRVERELEYPGEGGLPAFDTPGPLAI